MSTIRVSALKGAIHGVERNGSFVHGPYDKRSRLGRTEELIEPSDPITGFDPQNPHRFFGLIPDNLRHLMTRMTEPAIADLGDQPVVLCVHGFLFDPRDAVSSTPADSDNPHARIFHYQPNVPKEVRDHTTGLLHHLGFDAEDETGTSGLAFAYGWHSRPGFAGSLIGHFQNFYARAYDNAEQAAWNLLTCVHMLNEVLPAGKRIDLFCHSLGSRVVIRMIAQMCKHGRVDLVDRLDRVVILGGAEYVVEARLMLQRLHHAARPDHVQFYNIVSRENDVLDKLGENFGPRTFGNSNVIGHNGLDVENPESLGPSWIDIQIDGREVAAWMRDRHGFDVTGDNPESVWDHWYYYTDHGNMALYRAILRDRGNWNIPDLRRDPPSSRGWRVSRRRSVFGD